MTDPIAPLSRPPLRRRGALALSSAALVVAACSPTGTAIEFALGGLDADTPVTGYVASPDQAYGLGPRQRLDVYAPLHAMNAPVVVFWYGGGWRDGSRKQYRFVAEALVRQGLVVAVPDYRLAPAATWPAFVEDGAAATAWVAANIARFGGDPRRITLSGHSAGGHIAHVLALDPQWFDRVGVSRSTLAGIATISGVTGFERLEGPRWAPLFAAANPAGSHLPARLVASGAEGAPPFLLFAGAEDRLVPAPNTVRLARAIDEAGGTARTVIYPDEDHFTVLLGLSSRYAGERTLAPDLAAFVRKPDQA